MSGQSSADTDAAIQILAQEILDDLGVRDSGGTRFKSTLCLQAAVNQFLHRERERCVAICKKASCSVE
jgi:hypothetical protein